MKNPKDTLPFIQALSYARYAWDTQYLKKKDELLDSFVSLEKNTTQGCPLPIIKNVTDCVKELIPLATKGENLSEPMRQERISSLLSTIDTELIEFLRTNKFNTLSWVNNLLEDMKNVFRKGWSVYHASDILGLSILIKYILLAQQNKQDDGVVNGFLDETIRISREAEESQFIYLGEWIHKLGLRIQHGVDSITLDN